MILLSGSPYIFHMHVKFFMKVPKFPGLKTKHTINKMVWEFRQPVLDFQVREFSNFFIGFPYITEDGHFIFNEPVKAKLMEVVKSSYEAFNNLEQMKADSRYAAEIQFYRSRVDGQPDNGEDFADWDNSTPDVVYDSKRKS